MLKFGKPSKGRETAARVGEARREKRLNTNLVACDLGDVVDISKTGMRVSCSGKPPVREGQVMQMQLSANGQNLPIQGRIVWVRRRGLRAYQVGIHFVNVKSGIAAAVDSLAKWGFVDLEAARKSEEKKQAADESMRASIHVPNYYEVLGIKPTASQREIKQSYRILAMKYHPDVAKGAEAEDRFIRITEAYEVLSDPKSRRSYDTRVAQEKRRRVG